MLKKSTTLILKKQETYIKCGDALYFWIGGLDIVKISLLPKLMYRFDKNPNQNPSRIFTEINNLILKFA